jgi:GNAT superfamily N-acetyltransferase
MIRIEHGDIATAVEMAQLIPEFTEPAGATEYQKRLDGVPHLILIAFDGNKPVGFKVGYQKEDYFYSWMGAVLPTFRKRGIAKLLAEEQENWARTKGYKTLVFKTRNQHKSMLIFGIQNGFDIIGFTEKEATSANRILLKKVL